MPEDFIYYTVARAFGRTPDEIEEWPDEQVYRFWHYERLRTQYLSGPN